MSPSVKTNQTDPTVTKYHQLLDQQWTCKTEDGHQFILVSELEKWMRSRDPDLRQPNGGILLDFAYSQYRINDIDWKTLSDRSNSCVIVFALLLKLKYGHLVHIFKRVNLNDRNLGALSQSSENHLIEELQRNYYTEDKASDIARQFAQLQWAYAPVKFDLGLDQNYDCRSVFPFCRKEVINERKGATANLWQVAVREHFVEENLRAHVEGTKYEDKDHGICYRFVVKEFPHEHEDIFKAESDAFTALSRENGRGMIQCFGKYRHGNGESATHNILLEYGEQDLDEFFDDHYPPVVAVEVIAFWKELVRVADALDRVHRPVDRKLHSGQVTKWYGWHADIKPDNILRVDLEFKLADFGFARFERKRETVIFGGTDTYSAPELYRDRAGGTSTPHSNKIDVWSFGCVLSVSVTWVVLGSQGLKQYQSIREDAIRKLNVSENSNRSPGAGLIGDAFHNGTTVLDDVTHWHDYLRRLVRRSDQMSPRILDLLDRFILLEDPKSRISSAELHEKLEDIVVLGERDADELDSTLGPIANSILASIIDYNFQAPGSLEDRVRREITATKENGSKGLDFGRSAKSKRYENIVPGKVAHRQVLQRQMPTSSSTILSSEDGQTQEDLYESPIEDVDEVESDLRIPGDPASRVPHELPLGWTLRPGTVVNEAHNWKLPEAAHREQPAGVYAADVTPKPPDLVRPSHTLVAAVQQAASPGTNSTKFIDAEPNTQFPLSTAQTNASPSPRPEEPPASLQPRNPPLSHTDVLLKLRKKQKGPMSYFAKPDPFLKDFLTGRDLHFVVDNGSSMEQHWAQVQRTFECLARMVDGLDDDGVDLTFPFRQDCNRTRAKGHPFKKSWETLSSAMDQAKPTNDPDRHTDMAKLLGGIFDKYRAGKMTLIVLTDGSWEGETQSNETEKKIAGFLKSKAMKEVQEDRKFSIEFVSFGPANVARLNRLDNDMSKLYGVPDVVDHEPSTGDLRKMILGSFDKAFDARSEGVN